MMPRTRKRRSKAGEKEVEDQGQQWDEALLERSKGQKEAMQQICNRDVSTTTKKS